MRALILAAGLVSLTATNDMTAQVVYRDSDGRELTLSEVREVSDGVVRFELLSGRTVSDAAARLHVAGRDAASAGDIDRALDLFQQAVATAPDWPYPLYDIAFTYVLLEDYLTARLLPTNPESSAWWLLHRDHCGPLPRAGGEW